MMGLLLAAAVGVATGCVEVYPRSVSGCRASATTLCSLQDATAWHWLASQTQRQICLHPGEHALLAPLRLNASHSGVEFIPCSSPSITIEGSSRPVITGGLPIPTESWWAVGEGVWAAALPSATQVRHLRTLWVGGVRANRTVANATHLLGDLRTTTLGYETQRPVTWTSAAEEVELNYFQQLAPWQAQRCVVAHAAGHSITVVQPCFAMLSKRADGVPGLPRNRSSGRTGCLDSDPGCGHLLGNPLGSGLPMFIENIPLTDPGLPKTSVEDGQFSFSPREQKVYFLH